MTEQYQCKSYSDDNHVVRDCTCGKCGESWEEEFNRLCTVLVEHGGFKRVNGTMDSYQQALWLRKILTTRDASIRAERDKEILENILKWSKNVTVVETTGREGAGKATKKLRENLAGCYHFLYQAIRLDSPKDTTTHNEDKSV